MSGGSLIAILGHPIFEGNLELYERALNINK